MKTSLQLDYRTFYIGTPRRIIEAYLAILELDPEEDTGVCFIEQFDRSTGRRTILSQHNWNPDPGIWERSLGKTIAELRKEYNIRGR